MAESSDPKLTQDASRQTSDYNAAQVMGDDVLRGGTQGGEVARAMSGNRNEGTQDVATSGAIHVPTPERYDQGADVGPEQHFLAGGKSPADVSRYLPGISFPTKKEMLVRTAASHGAPEDIVHSLSGLPRTDYNTFEEVVRDYPRLPDRDDVGDRNSVGPGARR